MRAPAIQELLTPNPLDLILLLAVLKFALWALCSPHGSPGNVAASFPKSRSCEAWGAIGSSWLRGLQHLPGSGLLSSISCPELGLGLMQSGGLSPGGSLRATSPCCPSQEGGSRVGTSLIPADTSGARVSFPCTWKN